MRRSHTLWTSLFLVLLLVSGLAGFSAAFAGDTEDCEKGDACCAAKVANSTAADLEVCADEGEGTVKRAADAPRVGIFLADGTYYPISTCAVTGDILEPASPKTTVTEIDGRQVVLCCPGCTALVESDPARVLANMDIMIREQQSSDYPLTTCPMTGDELGGIADPPPFIVDNYLVKVCCAGCETGVRANPDDTLAALREFWSAVPAAVTEASEAPEAPVDSGEA